MDKKYSVIVFDLGNVLLPFGYHGMIEKLEQVEAGLGKRFADFYKNNYDIHRKFERGGYSEAEFTEILLNILDNKISRENFYSIYSNIFSVNERLIGVLPSLKKNYQLVLMSNTNAIHRKYGWGNYEFFKYFDKLVLSYEVGAVKPDEKIYKAVEAFTQKSSQEHFFIDDILEYVMAAKQLGWDGVQFVSNEKLFEDFSSRGIKWNDGTVK